MYLCEKNQYSNNHSFSAKVFTKLDDFEGHVMHSISANSTALFIQETRVRRVPSYILV